MNRFYADRIYIFCPPTVKPQPSHRRSPANEIWYFCHRHPSHGLPDHGDPSRSAATVVNISSSEVIRQTLKTILNILQSSNKADHFFSSRLWSVWDNPCTVCRLALEVRRRVSGQNTCPCPTVDAVTCFHKNRCMWVIEIRTQVMVHCQFRERSPQINIDFAKIFVVADIAADTKSDTGFDIFSQLKKSCIKVPICGKIKLICYWDIEISIDLLHLSRG